jgi:enoyl-CoA hydratase
VSFPRGEVTPAGLVARSASPGVLEVLLHRPEVRNAISTPLLRELVAFLDEAEADPEVRAVVITGGDTVFAAGADLSEMATKDMQGILLEERPRLYHAIARFPKPLVAAVCGYALGAGCELAMHADIIVAGESAQFGQPEIRLGIMPGAGGTQRLTRAVGKSLAMKMVLAGEFIGAGEAKASGLVAEVVSDAECLPRARALAGKIAAMAPLAARLAKDAVLQAFDTGLQAGLALERRNFTVLAGTDDRNEGVRAFLEKRKPGWTGR